MSALPKIETQQRILNTSSQNQSHKPFKTFCMNLGWSVLFVVSKILLGWKSVCLFLNIHFLCGRSLELLFNIICLRMIFLPFFYHFLPLTVGDRYTALFSDIFLFLQSLTLLCSPSVVSFYIFFDISISRGIYFHDYIKRSFARISLLRDGSPALFFIIFDWPLVFKSSLWS